MDRSHSTDQHSGEHIAAQFQSLFSRNENLRFLTGRLLSSTDEIATTKVLLCKNLDRESSGVETRDIAHPGSECPTETLLGYTAPSEADGMVVAARSLIHPDGRMVFAKGDEGTEGSITGWSAIASERSGWVNMRTDMHIPPEKIVYLDGNAQLTLGAMRLAFGMSTGKPEIPVVLWMLKFWKALVVGELVGNQGAQMSWEKALSVHPLGGVMSEMVGKPVEAITPKDVRDAMMCISDGMVDWHSMKNEHKTRGITGLAWGSDVESQKLLEWMDLGFYSTYMHFVTTNLFGGEAVWDGILEENLEKDVLRKIAESYTSAMRAIDHTPKPLAFADNTR